MILNIPEELKQNTRVSLFFNDLIKQLTSKTKYYGEPNVNGSYKVVNDDTDLKTYRLESGVWVVKDIITP